MDGLRSMILGWFRGWIPRSLVVITGLALFLLIAVAIGRLARDGLHGAERYKFPFAGIDCPAPPGQDIANFLVEVRYLADLPEELHLLDDNLSERLAQAFTRHPWVEKVERVEITAPRQVRVQLRYRTPVLAVVVTAEGSTQRLVGVVDRHGILLPQGAAPGELPVFICQSLPAGPAGTAWGDPGVEAVARTAEVLRPYRKQLRVASLAMEGDGLVLKTTAGATILWGRPPGAEEAHEAPAARKVKRLLGLGDGKGEYDVRPAEGKPDSEPPIHPPGPSIPFPLG